MTRFTCAVLLQIALPLIHAINLSYLDPLKLQTLTSPQIQQDAASNIIMRHINYTLFSVQVDPELFGDHKDAFVLRTIDNKLHIRASTGVAAVWGFNYYLKKYCKSQIAWQAYHVNVPDPLPEVDESVVSNDRFRYYQNVCTASYSFVWWDEAQWTRHVEWMALNGINLALAPFAQEAAWERVYRRLGMTDDEIDDHFAGPAFLAWLRMGNFHGWAGPLPKSWHERQLRVQDTVVDFMFRLGMVPVFPAFNGHVPVAFSRVFPSTKFYRVNPWMYFGDDNCCDLFMDPTDPLFVTIGNMFLDEISANFRPEVKLANVSHVYTADPFNELRVPVNISQELFVDTANAIFTTLTQFDKDAVWLIQNWMFVNDPSMWLPATVTAFLTAVPRGRMLVLDLQAEHAPQYEKTNMYSGQPFIWCMLHNFGGTSGMIGKMPTINRDVYAARSRAGSTMIGIGLTPEGINQNYVMYDLMLETAWRTEPVEEMDRWLADYAERRYGCNTTAAAWTRLYRSVYNYTGSLANYGQYVMNVRPSLKLYPTAWYGSKDLFKAFQKFAMVDAENCHAPGFKLDLVDVTRQALQYRAEQLYAAVQVARYSTSWVLDDAVRRFLGVLWDMEAILSTNPTFSAAEWFKNARLLAKNEEENFLYELNARNQITLWGPNGEITDYATKQWAEMFRYYYIPRWSTFLGAVQSAKERGEYFDEASARRAVRLGVERDFLTTNIDFAKRNDSIQLAKELFKKWAFLSLPDLPRTT